MLQIYNFTFSCLSNFHHHKKYVNQSTKYATTLSAPSRFFCTQLLYISRLFNVYRKLKKKRSRKFFYKLLKMHF